MIGPTLHLSFKGLFRAWEPWQLTLGFLSRPRPSQGLCGPKKGLYGPIGAGAQAGLFSGLGRPRLGAAQGLGLAVFSWAKYLKRPGFFKVKLVLLSQ
jgi:hypothetical protein